MNLSEYRSALAEAFADYRSRMIQASHEFQSAVSDAELARDAAVTSATVAFFGEEIPEAVQVEPEALEGTVTQGRVSNRPKSARIDLNFD